MSAPLVGLSHLMRALDESGSAETSPAASATAGPTMPLLTPSASTAASTACSGVEMPKPTRTGLSLTAFTRLAMTPADVATSARSPVIPMRLTA